MKLLNDLIVKFVKILPESIVYIFAKKYVAGKKLSNAVEVAKKLNEKKIMATIDVLGESVDSEEEALKAKEEILEVLQAIEKNKLDANISIKPTQLGLTVNKDFCYENIKAIVQRAKELNNFVRIDMEDSPYTDLTFEILKKIKAEYDNVGVVVQAYLRRTFTDVENLNKARTNYRLCKGIYIEPEKIAYKDREEVRENYLKILTKMLDEGNYVGIATHDKYLVEKAYELLKEKNIDKSKFEFQMLYGVTEKLRNKIVGDGYKLRVYIPFGEKWYACSVRRLQENPNMAWYITKSIFTRS